MAFLQVSSSTILPVFYNVSANTGRNSPNQPEDVALVSYLMKKICAGGKRPKIKPYADKVTIGIANEAYFQCIDAIQQDMKSSDPSVKPDGRVSKATPQATYDGKHGYMICILNYHVAKENQNEWPRLDRMSDCPPAVAALVNRVVMPA